MSRHPYQDLPDHAFWRKAVAARDPAEIDPAVSVPFILSPQDRVVTAGSCFAQHIGPMLRALNHNFLMTEAAHPIFPDDLSRRFGYGVFSARYGNIYTARQLLQLWYRAYGVFSPREDIWEGPDGVLIDPFRPQIQPRGFLTRQEYERDRQHHFAAVRHAFESMQVFVFTLGLTECWRNKEDGAVFPLCPGVAGGVFDAKRHEFHNFTLEETVSNLTQFIDTVRRRNPACRVILTVSPVPLAATAQAQTHVLAATTYSKAVLRVAAEMVTQARPGVAYFPSYEIINGRHDGGTYFEPDQRTVNAAGVAHVMRVFALNFANIQAPAHVPAAAPTETQVRLQVMEDNMRVFCDEMVLDQEV